MKRFSTASLSHAPRRRSAGNAVPAADKAVSGDMQRRAVTGLTPRRTGGGKDGSLPPFSPSNKRAESSQKRVTADEARNQRRTGLFQRAKLTEAQIQEAVFENLERRGAPGIVAFHPANGGVHQSTPWRRVRNSRMGVLSGMPDVGIIKNGHPYFLELKALGGKVSAVQDKTMDRLRMASATTGIAYGIDDAIAWLERHKLLIGRTI